MYDTLKIWILKTCVSITEDVRQQISRHMKNERGMGALEYGLVLAVIVVMIIVAAKAMGPEIDQFFQDVMAKIKGLI
jgi:Flp pilus assembly pilin Flp